MENKTFTWLLIFCVLVIGFSAANIYFYNNTLSFIACGNQTVVSESSVSSTIIANGVAIAVALLVLIVVLYMKMKPEEKIIFKDSSTKYSPVKMSSIKSSSTKESATKESAKKVSLNKEDIREIEREIRELLPIANRSDEIICDPKDIPACRIERVVEPEVRQDKPRREPVIRQPVMPVIPVIPRPPGNQRLPQNPRQKQPQVRNQENKNQENKNQENKNQAKKPFEPKKVVPEVEESESESSSESSPPVPKSKRSSRISSFRTKSRSFSSRSRPRK